MPELCNIILHIFSLPTVVLMIVRFAHVIGTFTEQSTTRDNRVNPHGKSVQRGRQEHTMKPID